ncbi:MAG: hypothetical protein U5N56_01055 [Candidatus Marinimicrobia bacterium]|nr:hypothetical protein [Candidatus Neomarinimicrobiota bacterium]
MADKVYEDKMIDSIARKIVARRLSVPAVLFMEVMKPLNFFGAQALNFFGPIIESFLKKDNRYYDFTEMLEKRENVERILQRIEELENETPEKPRKEKKDKKSLNSRNNDNNHHTC